MLVTFKCKVSGNVMMFGDVAKHMLKLMGFCESIPGAISAEDIPVALANLRQSVDRIHRQEVEALKDGDSKNTDADDIDEAVAEPVISLKIRAMPLIEMLEAADKEKCHIMWE